MVMRHARERLGFFFIRRYSGRKHFPYAHRSKETHCRFLTRVDAHDQLYEGRERQQEEDGGEGDVVSGVGDVAGGAVELDLQREEILAISNSIC